MIDVLIAIVSSCAMIILNYHYSSTCCGRQCCTIEDSENITHADKLLEQYINEEKNKTYIS